MTKDTTVSTTAHLLPDGEKDPRLGGNAGMSSDYLEVRGLSVDFGGFKAVRDVDLTLFQGDLRFLIGPNGAGKTTIIDAITGLVPSTGSIQKSGVELVGKKVHQIARLGYALQAQVQRLHGAIADHQFLRCQQYAAVQVAQGNLSAQVGVALGHVGDHRMGRHGPQALAHAAGQARQGE